ncbi:hypothetical protein HYR54_03835 [Candidatus Acetothermia bacterium]|nr:hypothetical protein [Candidatus Acetothermia bacterium]
MTKKILAVILILGLGIQATGLGKVKLVGNWASSATLKPESHAKVDGTLVGASSTFIIGAFEGDIADSPSRSLSRLFLTDPAFTDFGTAFQVVFQLPTMPQGLNKSVLHLQGYNKQKIIFDFPVGSLLWTSDLALSPGATWFVRYYWNRFFVTYAGVILTDELLVIPTAAGVIPGMKLAFKGSTFGGAGVELINLFGINTDLSLIGGGPPGPPPSLFDWTSTELNLSGLSFFDWVSFDNTTRFSRKNGFEFVQFDFDIEPQELELIKFDFFVKVSSSSTLMVLTTMLDLDIAFLYIYSDPVIVHGFNVPFVDLGSNELLSASLALQGNLYKKKGARDMDLKARDYYVDLVAFKDPLHYEKTNFDAAFSLEGRAAGVNFWGNLYFKLGSFVPILFTGRFSYEPELTKELGIGGGISVDPTGGLKELVANIEWWFSSY